MWSNNTFAHKLNCKSTSMCCPQAFQVSLSSNRLACLVPRLPRRARGSMAVVSCPTCPKIPVPTPPTRRRKLKQRCRRDRRLPRIPRRRRRRRRRGRRIRTSLLRLRLTRRRSRRNSNYRIFGRMRAKARFFCCALHSMCSGDSRGEKGVVLGVGFTGFRDK